MTEQDTIVKVIDDLFDTLHHIIVSFFFKLAIFTPALVNAVLVGFGIGTVTSQKWGPLAGLIAGIVTAIAIEAASIIASLNFNNTRIATYVLPFLYVSGSWIVTWIGLNEGWLINVVGFVMPIFAISLPAVVTVRQQKIETHQAEVEAAELSLATEQEKTRQEQARIDQEREKSKQERAKVRREKVSNLRKNDVKQMSKEDALLWLTNNPEIAPTEAANELGVSRQTIYNYRLELNGQNNGDKVTKVTVTR